MIFAFETTIIIFFWLAIISVAFSLFAYQLVIRAPLSWLMILKKLGSITLIPVLIVAPVVLSLTYYLTGINLIFPVRFFTSPSELLTYGLMPALILALASGLVFQILSYTSIEFQYWEQKSFSFLIKAWGGDLANQLRRLVVTRTLVLSWQQSLPWIFGDLILVESIFNAPGLGLNIWDLAKVHDWSGLLHHLMMMVGLYLVFNILLFCMQHWLGRRLENYV